MGDFSYNGKNSSLFNVHYAPDAQHRGNPMETYEVIVKEQEGRNGGYYYQNKVNKREFELQCYCENMTETQKSQMIKWLDRNTSGKLIFDENPYIYYDVYPMSRIETELYASYNGSNTLYNGTITIKFVACEPFGKMSIKSIDDYNNLTNKDTVLAETGIILTSMMPTLSFSSVTSTLTFMIYNPGNELTDCKISVQGNSGTAGVTVYNANTKQYCTITNITTTNTTNANKTLVLDSHLGKTYLLQAETTELAFGCHDLGYIQLSGCGNVVRDIVVSANSTTVTSSTPIFDASMVDRFILLDGNWKKIVTLNSATSITINSASTTLNNVTTVIADVNVLTVSSTGSFNLSTLQFDFLPYVK